MLRKMCMNVVFLCCMALLSAVGAVNCPPLAGAKGVESQGLALDPDRGVEPLSVPSADQGGIDSYTKLMLHADGFDQGTSFTDSSSGAKTITNTETYDSYTKLMLHIENNVTDSAAGKTVTNNNATFSSAVYKMGGYSGVFNGSNAYLSLADSDDWNFGTGDFTIDLWVKFNSLPPVNYAAAFYSQRTDGNNESLFGLRNDGNLYFKQTSGGANVVEIIRTPSSAITTGQWYHIALMRNGNVFRIYVGGTQVGSDYTSSATLINYSGGLVIGVAYADSPTHFLDGWIDELRISKGIARWTSDFTPPSSPYGKVAAVTSQKKFGTASGEFKGSGEYLSLADSDDWNFGSGDFSIDFWVRTSDITNEAALYAQGDVSTSTRFYVKLQSGEIKVDIDNTVAVVSYWTSGSGIATNTWHHVAIVRNGNTFTTYVDGTSRGSATSSVACPDASNYFTMGAAYSLGGGGWGKYLNGWLDELRISKGIARWTSNFTSPTAPYETDTTAPTVSSTSPASSATGVGVSSAISATFSEDMDSSTITTSTFTLSSSSSSGSSIRQAQDRSVGWVKRSAPNETGDDEDGCCEENPPPAPLQRGTTDGFASLNPSYTENAFTPTSSSVSGTVSYSDKVATFTPSSNLSYSTTYTATITTGVKDLGGNAMSSAYTWSFTTGSAPDTTAPTGSVSGASYTNSSTVTLTLTATDSVGVTGYYVSDSSTTPSASASGWTAVTSTTSYSGTVSYSLSSGEGSKTIYAWYKDAAGNVSSTASATITLDTTVPTVTISSPTSSSIYTATTSTISLGGSASDSSSGISSVSWSNNRGGNGTATGTASWTVSGISLSSGDNVITVTAKDGAGNSGTDSLQVTYSTGSTISAPTVSTGSASSVTTSLATLNGTVNANGGTTTAWFQYGSTSGSYGNTSSTQSVTGSSNTTVSIGISGLSSNTKYYYRIAASNSGGTSYGSESSFTTSTATATPTPTPTPTAAPTATTTPKPTPTAQPTPTRPPTLPPLPTPQPSPSPATNGIVFGFVNDEDEQPLEGVTVTITGAENQGTETDENGYYEFSGLDAGEYAITYEKEGFLAQTLDISLEEGGLKDVETVILEQVEKGKIYGYAVNIKGSPIEFVRLKLKGIKTKVTKSASTDADGFFEFADMEADTYVIIAKKKGYRKNQQKVKLEEGASEEIEIVMKKTSKRIKELLLEEDVQ